MMIFRTYHPTPGITEDYFRVRNFFSHLGYTEFTYARWDWVITHSYLDKQSLGKIGLWEDDGKLVGVATYDTMLGNAYCLTLPGYETLKRDMLIYAKEHLASETAFGVVIATTDHAFQDIAADLGFFATTEKEDDAIFYTERTPTTYRIPEGFHLTSMQETYNLEEYKRIMWKGFNHELDGEGEFVFTKEKQLGAEAEMKRANVDLDLKLAVVAPDGHFASYCGMWYDELAGYAVIEPVATDPAYRRMGLGKAVVLEGIRRVAMRGAKEVLVGSSQQFYYSIGMRPYASANVWRELHLKT